ncbi:hypothetical protein EKO04_000739 [Ascochyta lentis]|uniref:Uncharacterized protein n=1 Tax=Ascochyta lentis TaxID=205686 RepID=A0A8H7MMB3_9PLEO|nr:hypothetical protein EKO04_000739 [Ascochyta lentis]
MTATACVAPVTVTVTETVCGTPGVPVHTPPVAPSYEAPPPPPAPVTSVESTATAPLSGPPSEPATVIPPAPPAETGVPSVGVPPVVPSSGVIPSSGVAPSSSVKLSTASVPGTTTAPSSTAAVTHPSASTSIPETVSTAGAVLPTPYFGLGSLVAAGAVFNAAMAVIV